jgi:hypothetical protein
MEDAGKDRLLRDIGAVERMLRNHRPPAEDRVRALIGDALADRLLFALTDQGLPARGRSNDEGREIA